MKITLEQLEKRIELLEDKININNKIKQVIPSKTLIWGETNKEKMNWEDAKKWCKEQGGRLPTRGELIEAYDSGVKGFSQSDYYWSSTSYQSEGNHNLAWLVYFYNGYTYYYGKSNTYAVRCVR